MQMNLFQSIFSTNFLKITAIHYMSTQIEQCECIGIIFAFWHLAITITSIILFCWQLT